MYKTELINPKEFAYKDETLSLAGMHVSGQATRDLCSHFKIPFSLFNFQKRTPISIIEPVLATLPDVKAVVNEQSNTVEGFVHPNKTFVEDDDYQHLKERVLKTIPDEFDLFGLDTFSYNIGVDRPLTGGVTFHADLVRLACLNGAKTFHPECSNHYHSLPSHTDVDVVLDKLSHFSPTTFLTSVFGVNASRPASVFDLVSMANSSGLPEDELSLHFPISEVREHYNRLGYDIDKLSLNTLSTLKAGVSYYDCFNFLTYVITHKANKEDNMELQIKASRFLSQKSIKDYEHLLLSTKGTEAPSIKMEDIARYKGDTGVF